MKSLEQAGEHHSNGGTVLLPGNYARVLEELKARARR